MAFSEALEKRLTALLFEREDGVHERIIVKKMFGGLAYLLEGKMSLGIVGDALMVRVRQEHMEQAMQKPGARPMEFTGRPMKEFVFVDPEGYIDPEAMQQWIEWGLEHARHALGETI